jgi:hypothetical protein
MNFNEEHTLLGDLNPGDVFLSKTNNIGVYLKPLDDGHLIQNTYSGDEYTVPHGNFPIFKMKSEPEKTYNNDFKKKDYVIKLIDKKIAYEFIKTYHYLGAAKFFAKFSYGMYHKGGDELLGVTAFSNPQGNVALKGWFGLPNTDQSVLELSRLCVMPNLNGTNATSFLLSTSIKLLKKEEIRAVITLADDSRHTGSIYQVCNFSYYGLTNKKSDFFSYTDGGKVNPRGTTKEKEGVWISRTRKHRYAFIINKDLICLYDLVNEKPKKDDTSVYDCCNGTQIVTDKRFNVSYSCPKCTHNLEVM